MKRGVKLGLALVFLGLLLAAAALAGWLVWGLPSEHVRLFIDGERIDIPPLTAGHWLVAVIGLVIAFAVVLVVVPVVAALTLSLPLLIAVLMLALLFAPIALVVWVLWRLLRRASAGGATMRG